MTWQHPDIRIDESEELFRKFQKGGLAYLQQLKNEKTTEGPVLDFKLKASQENQVRKDGQKKASVKDTPDLHDNDKDNLAKALSGFANTAGGVLVWGVYCTDLNKKEPDVVQDLYAIPRVTEFYTNLMNATRTLLEPKAEGVRFERILEDAEKDTGYVIMHIPKREYRDEVCRALGPTNKQCYMRVGASFDAMDMATLSHRHREGIRSAQRNLLVDEQRVRENTAVKVQEYFLASHFSRTPSSGWLPLQLEEWKDALENPFGIIQETKDCRLELASDSNVSKIFAGMTGPRTLLVLGGEASGKSTILLDVAKRSIDDKYQPVPIIFRLASWANQKTLTEWLETQFDSKYDVSREYVEHWMERGSVILILDGLDEVRKEWRQSCVEAINSFVATKCRVDVIVSCRTDTYFALASKLRFNKALCVQALSDEQILELLLTNCNAHETENLCAQIFENDQLLRLARSPLMLRLMIVGFAGRGHLPVDIDLESCYKGIISQYIDRLLEGTFSIDPKKTSEHITEYTLRESRKWLSWVASRLNMFSSEPVFFIEGVHPWWLDGGWPFIYLVPFIITSAVIAGAIMFPGLLGENPFRYLTFAICVLLAVFFCTLLSIFVIPVHTLRPNWNAIRQYYIDVFTVRGMLTKLTKFSDIVRESRLYLAGLFGVILMACAYFAWQQHMQWSEALVFALILALLASIVPFVFLFSVLVMNPLLMLPGWLRGPDLEVRTIPNKVIWNSLKNGIISGLIMATIMTGFNFCFLHDKTVSYYLAAYLRNGAIAFSFGFLITGGFAFLQHFWIRLLLHISRRLPWKLIPFLDYGVERGILLPERGGYKFEHAIIGHFLAQEGSRKTLSGAQMLTNFVLWYQGGQTSQSD